MTTKGENRFCKAVPVATIKIVSAVLLGTALAARAACVPAPAGLVSWWRAESNASDLIGGNPGNLINAVAFESGEVGQAFKLDGTSAYVRINASASLNVGSSNGLTIEAWIKPADLRFAQPLVEFDDGHNLGIHLWISEPWFGGQGGPGDLFANITDPSGGTHALVSVPGVLNTNNFQHVAVTYDKTSGLGVLYVNGAIVYSYNLGHFTPQTTYDLYLGYRPSSQNAAIYQGLMDEVSLYSRALSQSEIQSIVSAGVAGKCAGSNPIAPSIVTQPADQSVQVGGTASLSVVASGDAPLLYQWQFNGSALADKTNAAIVLPNVQITDGGYYSVIVSNAVGSVVSSNALLSIIPPQTNCIPVPSGLVSWWQAEGNADDLASGNSGALSNGVSFAAGETGQAFSFDGNSSYIVAQASPTLNVGLAGGLTVECWIKPNDLTTARPLVEWNDGSTYGVHLWINEPYFNNQGGPGDLFANITDTSGGVNALVSAPGVLNNTSFQHVAVTYDKASGMGVLYVNGTVVYSYNLGQFTPQTSYPMYLGIRPSPQYPSAYSGLMDEVSLYDRALSQDEIQAIVAAGTAGKCSSPTAPFLISQPGDQTVDIGANATFSVVAAGSRPLSYQWSFNGAAIDGASSATLTISNAQPSDAGNYVIQVTNAYGSIVSSNALLTIVTHPPTIATQPQSLIAHPGNNATFTVSASGATPLYYQWRKGGVDITGAGASTLTIVGVQPNDEGNYSVAISNLFGSVLSSDAILTVVPLQTNCVAPGLGLVGWWKAEGDVADSAGGNSGAISNDVSFVMGETGQAFDFDGNSGYVVIPSSSSLDVGHGGGLTIECWIKPGDLTAPRPLVEWNNVSIYGVQLWINEPWFQNQGGPGGVFANIIDTYGGTHALVSAPGVLNTSSFQHVAVTYDKASGMGVLYVNGTVVYSYDLGHFTPQTSYNLYLGRRPSPQYASTYLGLMDEVSVYSRALSQTEIQAIVDADSAGKCTGPLAPYIITQPANQAVPEGSNATFSVLAGGDAPLLYQWLFNGAELSGETAASLALVNVQSNFAGYYSVRVSNTVGVIVSSSAILNVVTPQTNCLAPASGLVSWWRGEGSANDSVDSNSGTVSNGVSFASGEAGQGFSFDGSSGYVIVPASSTLDAGKANGLTIECWIKPGDLTTPQPLLEWNNGSNYGVHLWINEPWFDNQGGQGSLFANISDIYGGVNALISAPGVLNTSGFQHVAVTYDKASGLGVLYVNGTVVYSHNLGHFTPQTSYDLYFGVRPSAQYPSIYSGLMDEISLYSRALSQSEIQAIVDAGSNGKCVAPVPPSIVTQPTSQIVPAGYGAQFNVVAAGHSLQYQWRFNNAVLTGQTNAMLLLANIQTNNAGAYSVSVANSAGSVLSSNALLVRVLTANQAAARLSQPKQVPAGFSLSLTGVPGLSYTLERAPAISGPWKGLGSMSINSAGVGTFTDTNAPAAGAFYRTTYP